MRRFKAMGFGLFMVALLSLLGRESRKHFFLNLTESEPRGLYRVIPATLRLAHGELVLFYPPGQFEGYVYGRGWLPHRWPLLKHVGALPGDTFCVEGDLFWVRGKPLGRVFPVDNQGLPLPRLSGCKKVREGHFLPVAKGVANSFDGRYMGDILQSLIMAKATPLWTR